MINPPIPSDCYLPLSQGCEADASEQIQIGWMATGKPEACDENVLLQAEAALSTGLEHERLYE